MKTLLIHNKTHFDFFINNTFDDVIDIADFNSELHENTHEKEIEQFEWVLEEVNKKSENIEVLIISNFLMFDDEELCLSSELGLEQSAFALALHIRFHSNDNVKYLPIIILSFKTPNEIIKISYEVPQIITTEGLFVVNPNDITDKEISTLVPPDDQYALTKYHNEPSIKTIVQILNTCSKKEVREKRKDFLRKVVVKDFSTSNHDIANQWGAYRMAQVAGIEEKIEYKYPKTLYFKYLLAQSQEPEPEKLTFPTGQKILFIDDNYQKGWKDCLEGLFGKGTIEAYVSWQEAEVKGEDKKIKDGEYDLIFLDFYLSEQDRKGAGQDILEIIKGKKDENDQEVHKGLNPVVPVIMFTASNKAWNMDKLYEAGADGYYVKEHPDNAHDADFSVENFKNFHETVKKCLKKGELLRKYWSKINLIKQHWNFTNKGNQKNKERIEERLTMFVGLLKKAYEQTKFDEKTFFYSDWELAFLTLWSTLNEIQEVYYEKTQPNLTLTDSQGTIYTHHLGNNNRPITYLNLLFTKHYKWVYGSEIFLEYDYSLIEKNGQVVTNYNSYQLDGKQKSPLKYDTKTGKYLILPTPERPPKDYQQILHVQIGFLLLKKNASEKLLTNLDDLNKNIRNTLYLTHGEDSSSPNFAVLYRDQRRTDTEWQKRIKQLFEIIYFLCTGQECDW